MPVIGEIKKDYEIGKGHKSDNYIWIICTDCNIGRWVKISDIKRSDKFTGLCHSCTLRKRNGKLDKSPHWKGGIKQCGGYIHIYILPDNKFASMRDNLGYVKRSRLIMAEFLGRSLLNSEEVHHEDENKSNDSFDNLRLFTSISTHIQYHRLKEIKNKGLRPTNNKGQYIKGGYHAN